MENSLPPVDYSIAPQVDSSFADADQRLRGACRHRKARKRIRQEDFDAVQTGRVNSVGATQSGLNSQQQARSGAFGARDDLNLASRLMGNSPPEDGQSVPDIIQVVGAFLFPGLPPNFDIGNVQQRSDTPGLVTLLGQSEMNGSELNKNLQVVGQQHASQMVQNNKIGNLVQKFSGIEQQFADKEAAFLKKMEQFSNLANKFDQVATSLVSASVAITGASSSIDAAAAACAAIPFVGPAISVALRVAATALRTVGRALDLIGKKMQVLSKTMRSSSIFQKASAAAARVEKVHAQVKRVANQASQKVGLARLQSLVQQRKQLQEHVSRNLADQQALRKRVGELGWKGPEKSQASRTEPVSTASAEMQLQQRCMEIQMLRYTKAAGPQVLEKQQALCQLYEQFARQKVAISAMVESKARKALSDSPFQPDAQLAVLPPEGMKGKA